MASYNRVILLGNLTRDPELKYLPNGNSVANFGLAISERYTDRQSGEQKETVCFVDVAAWGRQAEVVNEYLSKGSPVFLEGSLKFDSWEADDGTKRNKLSVTAFRIQLIGGRRDGDQTEGGYANAEPAAAPTQSESYQEAPAPEATSAPSATDDDIPF
ncbi:single-stranded DNA-binding protein [Candidatus Poribacteria bacterium]|nr:single-stranded DNA-binding protein [Candidatus Poribacteria bacterium]MYG06989.1 single-stranded DNA-binding protein [Candidatus Poribacteria bacterium]MYK23452.1 single-stranded DNA-binding protein [Candidatus Poribacteria bacterium]